MANAVFKKHNLTLKSKKLIEFTKRVGVSLLRG
jgi:hypothetical protein